MQVSTSARRTALAVVPILVVCGFWIVGGDRSGAGAALGVAMVVLFFAGGRAPMALARTTPAGPLFLLIAMGYVLRVVLLLAVFIALGDAGWVDHSAVASTVVSGALLWSAALVHGHATSRQPTLEIPAAPVLTSPGAHR
jgi:ATP synthase protein I